jgi:hypothetical protein
MNCNLHFEGTAEDDENKLIQLVAAYDTNPDGTLDRLAPSTGLWLDRVPDPKNCSGELRVFWDR